MAVRTELRLTLDPERAARVAMCRSLGRLDAVDPGILTGAQCDVGAWSNGPPAGSSVPGQLRRTRSASGCSTSRTTSAMSTTRATSRRPTAK